MNHATTPVLPTPIAGRTGELKVLETRLDAARRGRAGLVVISGTTGMGKTRLLRAFLESAADRDVTVSHGACGRTAVGPGYAAALALLGRFGLTGQDVADRPRAASHYQVLHRLHTLVAGLTADRPLVLVLDDAHACDEQSLRWLDFTLRRAQGLPLLVVLARRTEGEPAAPQAWADLVAQPAYSTVRLGPLGLAQIGALARQVFRAPVEPSFAERVLACSGGNPRRATRLLRALCAEGVRPDARGAHRAAELGGRLVVLSVHGRLARMPAWVREVATATAVLGEDSPDLVAALAGIPGALVQDALGLLRRCELVAARHPARMDEAVRRAVLDPLGGGELARLRTRAALLLSDAGRPAEQVAGYLLQLPGTPEPWMVTVLREAAALAEARSAPGSAAGYLHRVLEAEPQDDAVRLRLADALAQADPIEAVPLLREALARAADVRARARIAVQYGMTCLAAHQAPAAAGELAAILRALRAQLGPEDELRTAVESVLLITGSADRSTVAPLRRRVEQPAGPDADGAAAQQRHALSALLSALYGSSREVTVDHARQVVNAAGPVGQNWPLITSAVALGLADETQDALTVLERALRYGQGEHTAWTRALALSGRALVRYAIGAIPEAMADARTVIETVGEESCGARLALPRVVLASALLDRGETGPAADLLAGIARPQPRGSVLDYHPYLMARARVRWAVGDGEGALRLLVESGRAQREAGLVNPVFAPWWSLACEVLASLGRPDAAREYAEHGAESARRWGTARGLGLAALARGVITGGRPGVELLAEAVARLSCSPAAAEHARAEYALGRALLTIGDQAGAREHLRAAADRARCCGALALARAARRLLISAGGRMREITTSRVDMLTGAECKVAGLVVSGASNRQIAQTLFVTVRTVETHLTNVYRKLGVGHRAALASALPARAVVVPDGRR
ncbi:AAA family ATPase [Kitasatospora sp. NPDC058218]|uniref:AAA family ATPase n=1 Tax=Kitasatospora sp. NPDC058218 TaxID=3346385 RepID=UPI0036DC425B